jgi:hypothetical protein
VEEPALGFVDREAPAPGRLITDSWLLMGTVGRMGTGRLRMATHDAVDGV